LGASLLANVDAALTPVVRFVRIRLKREYPRRKAMLARVPDALPDTAGRDLTEVLLGVLRSIEPYEACILEAERDGDFEVAAFLRELRRQDILRAREATRLLKRSLEKANVKVVELGEARVELSAGS
jgi:hypothetical protein